MAAEQQWEGGDEEISAFVIEQARDDYDRDRVVWANGLARVWRRRKQRRLGVLSQPCGLTGLNWPEVGRYDGVWDDRNAEWI